MLSPRSIKYLSISAAFVLGIAAGRIIKPLGVMNASYFETSSLAGIERLHKLDTQATLLNSPEALKAEWTNEAVRLEPDNDVDIGKHAIYESDLKFYRESPGFEFVSYKPEIRDVQLAGDWAFEWGLFTAGIRPASGKPVDNVHGKLLRVLRREPGGNWKFARVMAAFDSEPNTNGH
jgi:ketosteroid isomerase-like protein